MKQVRAINKRMIPKSDDDHRKRKSDNDLRICTWNVRTLKWDGTSIQLIDILERYKANIIAIQEMRWKGQGLLTASIL